MGFTKLAISLMSFVVLFTGCGDTFRESKEVKELEIFKKATEFKDYKSNSSKWKKIETLFGVDPAIDSSLSLHEGTKKLFRTIYKSPKDASIGENGYPSGTMFLKELRTDDDGDAGELTASTTVMIKDKNQWTFIKLTPDLNITEAKGTQDGKDEVSSVASCINCHAQANEGYDFTFPITKRIDNNETNETIEDIEKSVDDFKSYKTWALVKETRGIDPAKSIGEAHGNKSSLFRRIYKKQLTVKVDGKYPIGTIFLLELRKPKDDNKTIGELDENITVMVKRHSEFDEKSSANNWEYFSIDNNLTEIITQGNSTDKLTKDCFNCHDLAQKIEPKKKNNDFIFPKIAVENNETNVSTEEEL